MTLPVSSYEELLNRVRCLTHETRQLQRQIDAPLLDHNENENHVSNTASSIEWTVKPRSESPTTFDAGVSSALQPNSTDKDVIGTRWSKEQGASPEAKEQEDTSTTIGNDRPPKLLGPPNAMCHSTATVNSKQGMCDGGLSYSYSYSREQLGTKVEMVYNLLSMLGTHDRAEMTSTLLAMSSSPDSCKAMRQSGCLSLLVQLVHSSGESSVVRQRAAQALRNMVLCHSDDKRGRREARVLRLLDQIIAYTDLLHDDPQSHTEETHPGPAIAALMKLSFDEDHRLAMCQLGALYVVARLVQVEAGYNLDCCITLKRYAGMALTNLTFGDGNNKALLCSMKPFMTALVAQLSSSSEDLTQVTASVLRNLSWRADATSKQALREVGSVPALMRAAMSATREPTLKSVLSALWNLSAHCNVNKVDICGVEGALQYLVEMLNYQSASKTLTVVENAGGILRNISSHIAVREDYRKILREHNCLAVLLRQLQSASLTVVSNACGTLWNLSARCGVDQRALVSLGAVPMLTSLAHSRHRMIAMGASAALKNLLPVRLAQQQQQTPSGGATLVVRKRRALEAELNSSLSETCDNIEPCPGWESDRDVASTPQANKEDCDQINHTMQQMTLDEATEQPVNYSLKYCEGETKNSEADNDTVNYSIKYKETDNVEQKTYNSCFKENVVSKSDYAETDLDQLTDYSLRYSEEEQTEQLPDSNNKCEEVAEKTPETTNVNSAEVTPSKLDTGKGIHLETPLMFSRCSSLGSLGSCEPHDDCQSSVVSEFSRMTSGVMSPSEVPDSPTQTVPPSPKVKAPPSLPAPVEQEKTVPAGVFDDTVVAFKEETLFSTATSLSDLTIDDEAHDTERKELELSAVSEEEDEHLLADCISIGMQSSNRERTESRDLGGQISSGANTSRIPRARGIPVKTSIPPRPAQHIEETPVQFCTEDTPASLSHATSHSELSCALSDASSDHENILAECIQSGMPQPQGIGQNLPKKVNKVQTVSPAVKVSMVKPRPVSIPTSRMRQLTVEDEVSVFADEGSPGNFSIYSSLSDLTINSKPERTGIPTPPAADNPSPLSSLEPEVSVDEGEAETVLSGTSADEVTLADQEDQALLMQVISSGMPISCTSIGNNGKMKESTDTWAEDTPNDISFSLTAPVIREYQSDDETEDKEDKTLDDHTLSESRVIKLESGKVALISHLDMENSYMGIDQVQPPSNMASILTLSCSTSLNDNENIDNKIKREFKLMGDDNSIMDCDTSLGDLDHIQPPSAMDSILSLSCSIDNTNNTDRKNIQKLSLTNGNASLNEASFLENIRPPTEMDELLDLDNSIMSVASLSSEIADNVEDITLETATPPQQRKTAKQRRDLGKFRYNTYVIRSEKKSNDKEITENEVNMEDDLNNTKTVIKDKLTPKQRRQADRDRFRTRTIHDAPAAPSVERLSSMESNESVPVADLSPEVTTSSEIEDNSPPRPIVTKPPEIKSIRGGGAGGARSSSIPVVRSPVKTNNTSAAGAAANVKKKSGNLQRQGTFTKDEAGSSIPIPIKKVASPAKKPLSGNKTVTNSSSSGAGSGRGRAASLPTKPGYGVRTSVSNQSLKSACSDQASTRWHSNSSLNSAPPIKKDATSKIASLWKKVDENKKKQQQQGKDTRVWIPPEPKSKQVA